MIDIIKKYHLILTIIVALIPSLETNAQQNNSLYFLNDVQQSNQLNPAIHSNCKFSIGGIIMPVTGQVLPPIYFNYKNNAFAYKDLIFPGSGLRKDSLITIFDSTANPYKFINDLKSINYLSFETNIDILQATLSHKNQSFSFSITDKISTRFYYSDDLIRFLYELNGDSFLGSKADFKIGTDFIYYREYGFGYQRNINEKLSIGLRAKLLFGKASIFMSDSKFSWFTDEENFYYTFSSDMEIKTSIPGLDIEEMHYNDSLHEFVIEDSIQDFDTEDIINYATNSKNFGFAFDLGATYILNEQFTFYGSIVDLGYIKWKSDVNTITNNGQFDFTGVDMFDILEDDSVEFGDVLMDSVFTSITVDNNHDPYKYNLPAKIYLGSKFNLNEKIGFGILIRTEIFDKKLHNSLSLSFNTNLSRNFHASFTYSMMHGTYNNMGIGLAYKLGPFQAYLVNDNLTSFIFPQSARNVNFRFGINWVFGCGVKNTTLIE